MANHQLDIIEVDVVVVGAGLSGLQAAVNLHEAGLTYVVLEATDRVGGKTLSVKASQDNNATVELGAAWINDTDQSEVYALSQKYGLEVIKQRTTGLTLQVNPDDTVERLQFDAIFGNEEYAQHITGLIGHIQELQSQINIEDPASSPNAQELDSMTFVQYAEIFDPHPVVTVFAKAITAAVIGVEGDEISCLYWLFYGASNYGFVKLISDRKEGAQYLRVLGGTAQLSKGLASELTADSIHLSSPVSKINQLLSGVVRVHTNTGGVFQCKKVVVSLPTPLYSSIEFTPALPLAKQKLSESTKLGYYSKVIYVFEKPWWHAAPEASGIILTFHGPISFTRDTSSPAENEWSITCFTTGISGRSWSKLGGKERRQAVWDQFKGAFKTVFKEVPEPIAVHAKEWTKDVHFQGAPCPVMPPGLLTSEAGKALRTPFDNVHFVGTETSVSSVGYMDGALRSGKRGAKEIIAALQRSN